MGYGIDLSSTLDDLGDERRTCFPDEDDAASHRTVDRCEAEAARTRQR